MFFLFRFFFYLTVFLWVGFVICVWNFDSDFDGITLDYSRQRATPGTMDKLYNLAEVTFERFCVFFFWNFCCQPRQPLKPPCLGRNNYCSMNSFFTTNHDFPNIREAINAIQCVVAAWKAGGKRGKSFFFFPVLERILCNVTI